MLIDVMFSALLIAADIPDTTGDNTDIMATSGAPPKPKSIWLVDGPPPHPADNAPNEHRHALGEKLFFDPKLSGNGEVACASCHAPDQGWADSRAFSTGVPGTPLGRATPTVVNSGYSLIQMWDGRFASLEEQALGPLAAADEMNAVPAQVIAYLVDSDDYQNMFGKAYPGEGITLQTLAKALAAYQRTIIVIDTPFDRWQRGDENAVSTSAKRGFEVFKDPNRGNCAACHQAPHFTDHGFHNIGVPELRNTGRDAGRHKVIPIAVLKGAFKTPGLRNISSTAPYFHNSYAKTLEEVVEHYIGGGRNVPNLSPSMKPLQLSHQEKADLVAFMKSLDQIPAQEEPSNE